MKSPEQRPDTRPDAFEQRARAVYREAARQLDPATTGRLRAARRQALATPSRRTSAHGWLIRTGAFAVLLVAALLIWQPTPRQPLVSSHAASNTAVASADIDGNELPPDADQTDPALYQNLDFYGWLAATDSPSGAR